MNDNKKQQETTMPNNYQQGKIYKIVSNIDDELCYVGSTTKKLLCQRMTDHRQEYNEWKRGGKSYTTSTVLFEKYGVENCHIELLEIFPCNSRDELNKREGEYMRLLNCVNRIINGRTKSEYYDINKDKISLYNKQLYIDKRDEILQRVKKRYEANKEEILKKRRGYYLCSCGANVSSANRIRHSATKRHCDIIASNTI